MNKAILKQKIDTLCDNLRENNQLQLFTAANNFAHHMGQRFKNSGNNEVSLTEIKEIENEMIKFVRNAKDSYKKPLLTVNQANILAEKVKQFFKQQIYIQVNKPATNKQNEEKSTSSTIRKRPKPSTIETPTVLASNLATTKENPSSSNKDKVDASQKNATKTQPTQSGIKPLHEKQKPVSMAVTFNQIQGQMNQTSNQHHQISPTQNKAPNPSNDSAKNDKSFLDKFFAFVECLKLGLTKIVITLFGNENKAKNSGVGVAPKNATVMMDALRQNHIGSHDTLNLNF